MACVQAEGVACVLRQATSTQTMLDAPAYTAINVGCAANLRADHMASVQAEGVAYVLRQATSAQTTPSLDTPAYTVLKRAGEYEVRRYAPYVVAEVGMASNTGPASGALLATL